MVTVIPRLFQGKSGKQNMGSLQTQISFFLICPLKVSTIMVHVFAEGNGLWWLFFLEHWEIYQKSPWMFQESLPT